MRFRRMGRVGSMGVVLLLAARLPAGAQLRSVGFHAGLVRSHQVRDRAADSGVRNGALFGVYIDPRTPKPWLSVLAELSYAQQGGTYELALPVPTGASGLVDLAVRTEYLTFGIAPEVAASFGPVSLFGYAGPSMDVLIRTRAAATLQSMLSRSSDQVFAAVTGTGVEVRTTGGRTLRLEARMNWGLSTAYTGDDGDIRYRSLEFLVRVGRHPLP